MIKFTEMTDEGVEIEHELPSKFEVCSQCGGHGTHLNPSIGEHAYSQEEFEEEFWDEEDHAEYFKRGGIYDVTCETCNGKRVEEVLNEEACPADLLKKYHAMLEDMAEYERERRAELAFGC